MCATHLVSGTVESATPAFETLLVHLAVESHGLDQSGMFRLFCRIAGEYFGAAGACCSSLSSQDDWIIGEAAGYQPWGGLGDTLPVTTTELVGLAHTSRRAIFHWANFNEVLWQHGDSERPEVVIPFLIRGKSLGAALMVWTEQAGRIDEPLLEQLTMLGAFFAGLLDHAHLFDQVHRSRQ